MSESTPNISCFVCNLQAGVRNPHLIFSDNETLPSGARLQDRLSEILGHRLQDRVGRTHSPALCRMCYKECEVYDDMQKRSAEIKTELSDLFKRTVTSYSMESATYVHGPELPAANSSKSPEVKRLVLPKSKLKPIPSDMLILHSKLALGSVNKNIAIKNSVFESPNKVVITPGSSLIKPQPSTSLEQRTAAVSPESIPPDSLNRMLRELGTPPKLKMEKYLDEGKSKLQSAAIDRDFHSIFEDPVFSQDKTPQDGQDPEENLILDELEGTIRQKTPTELTSAGDRTAARKDDEYVMEVEVLEESDLEVDDDTILMEQDASGSILHVVRGSKRQLLFSGNNEISLMMSGDGEEGTETSQHSSNASLPRFKIECQDSNDESQMELQMSGDEETANAIIEAAREHGATYIKMENGAVYRINTVESQQEVGDDAPPGGSDSPVVEKHGAKGYRCLLCPTVDNGFVVPDVTPAESQSTAAVFSDAPAAIEHAASRHKTRANICLVCGAVFTNCAYLSEHMRKHNRLQNQSTEPEIRLHFCSVCNKKFSTKTELQEHTKQHAAPKAHRCPSCQKEFSSKYSYHAHLKTHTDRPRPYKCPKCNKAFLTPHNLNQHEITHTAAKTFTCTTCGKSFATQHNLESHMMIHTGHKPYICSVCEKAFTRRTEIKDHMRIHTGERPFQCDICQAAFSQRSNLMSHRRLTHMNDKRHACDACDKKFKRRRLLDYHIKSCHTGERPFRCEVCSATFVYPEHYKKHLRIHSGQRPYDCEVCGKTFNSRDNRNAHRFIHSDKKPFECLVCGAGFMRKPQLYAHMGSRGHQAETIIVNQPQLTVNGVTLHMSELSESTAVEKPASEDSLQLFGSLSTPIHSKILEDEPLLTKSEVEAAGESDEAGEEGEPAEESSKVFLIPADGKLYSTVQVGGAASADGEFMFEASDQLAADNGGEQLEISDVEATHNSQIVDEHGNILRLVQIQLPDGKEGWVAINP